MTKDEILRRTKEIEVRANRATPGPWEYLPPESVGGAAIVPFKGARICSWWMPDDICALKLRSEIEHRNNGNFIAHAREDVPWLCQIVRRLIGRLEKLEAVARELLAYLPDCEGRGQDWDWAWNELSVKSQDEVKEVRRRAEEVLAALEEGQI